MSLGNFFYSSQGSRVYPYRWGPFTPPKRATRFPRTSLLIFGKCRGGIVAGDVAAVYSRFRRREVGTDGLPKSGWFLRQIITGVFFDLPSALRLGGVQNPRVSEGPSCWCQVDSARSAAFAPEVNGGWWHRSRYAETCTMSKTTGTGTFKLSTCFG